MAGGVRREFVTDGWCASSLVRGCVRKTREAAFEGTPSAEGRRTGSNSRVVPR